MIEYCFTIYDFSFIIQICLKSLIFRWLYLAGRLDVNLKKCWRPRIKKLNCSPVIQEKDCTILNTEII